MGRRQPPHFLTYIKVMNAPNKSRTISGRAGLPFICFFATYVALNLWFKTPAFAMPNITGCQLADATKICSSHHLRLEIIQTKEDPELPDGTVIHQTPSAGHPVKERQTIFIATSHQPPIGLMPSVTDLPQEAVEAICKQHNLKPKFYPVSYPYPAGHCFGQCPAAGMPLNDKTVICYVAGQEEQYALWPHFIGSELQPVIAALTEQGITTHTNLTQKSGQCYFITDQQPKAGARIDLSRSGEIIANFKISTKQG